MQPYYEHAGITIYNGDARDVWPSLGGTAALITDPPFGINFSAATWSDKPEDYPEMVRWVVAQACDSVSGWCFVFQSGTNIERFPEWFPSGFRVFAACKNFAQMRPTEISHSWDPVVFWKNTAVVAKYRSDDGVVTRDFHVGDVAGALARKAGHPSPRPLNTMRHLVLVGSRAKQTVLDPFMGSGTTLVAAKLEGRKAIGIEIEERYCEVAAKRLAQEVFDFS